MKKKQKPLEKDIAERIAEEEFNRNYEHHDFSNEYHRKKSDFLDSIAQKKRFTWTRKKIIFAAASFLVIIPTAGFTGNKLYQWYASQNQYKTVISIDNTASEDNKFYQLDFGYLPDNMKELPHSENKYSYDDNDYQGGFTFTLWKIPGHAEFTEFNTKNYTEKTYGDNQAYLVDRQPSYFSEGTTEGTTFSRIVYLSFEKEGYVLEAYVGSDVSQEDLDKVLSNVSLKETTEDNATESIEYNESIQNAKNPDENQASEKTSISINSPNLVKIGQSVTTEPHESNAVDFRVESVEVLDSIKNFDQTNFNDTFLERMVDKKLLSDDLTLQPYKQKTIKLGDGETTIDEIVGEQIVTPKFVYITAMIQNQSNAELEDLYLQDSPIFLDQQDDNLVHEGSTDEQADFSSSTGEVDYLDSHGVGKSYYRLPTLQANEKRTIHFGFFIDDNQLNKMVLPVFNYSNPDDLSNDNYYWVDIRQ